MVSVWNIYLTRKHSFHHPFGAYLLNCCAGLGQAFVAKLLGWTIVLSRTFFVSFAVTGLCTRTVMVIKLQSQVRARNSPEWNQPSVSTKSCVNIWCVKKTCFSACARTLERDFTSSQLCFYESQLDVRRVGQRRSRNSPITFVEASRTPRRFAFIRSRCSVFSREAASALFLSPGQKTDDVTRSL